MSSEHRPPQPPCTWVRLAATCFCIQLVLLCIGMISPLMPEVQIQYFRRVTDCALYDAGETTCASQASTANGLTQSLSSFGTLLLAPYFGARSDELGRRPFFRIAILVQVLPLVTLSICWEDLRVFYLLQALNGFAPNASAIFFTVMADVLSPTHRMQCFGIAMASFLGAFSVGAGLSVVMLPLLGPGSLLRAGATILGTAAVVAAALLPETLPREGQKGEEQEEEESAPVVRSKSLVRIIAKPSSTGNEQLLHTIALIGLLSSIPEAGVPSIALFYAKAKLHLSGQDITSLGGKMLSVVGLSGFLWQSLGLAALKRICPSTLWIYQVALLSNLLHLFGYLVAWAPWVILANGLSAGGALAQPTILRGLVSQALPANIQGYASGVLSGVEAACRVAGPALFSGLFLVGGQAGAPWLPFAFGMALVIAGSLLAASRLDGHCRPGPEASPSAASCAEEPLLKA